MEYGVLLLPSHDLIPPIIISTALPLEADIILEMRLLLSLSEWTKYSPHVCMEVGKTGIIHLLNGIVSSTTQSFRLSEVSCRK